MKLTLEKLLANSLNYQITIDTNKLLDSLTYNKKRNIWTLRLFNTSEHIASTPALYNKLNTSTLVNHIDYARTQSKKPLLFLKKQLIGTNNQKIYTNVRYHHSDIKGHRNNRKTELIVTSDEVQNYIDTTFDTSILLALHTKLMDFFNAKLPLEYLTPQRLQILAEAAELHRLDDSLEKTVSQLKCALKLEALDGDLV